MSCAKCRSETATNLCDECASELDTPVPFIAEQILSAAARPLQGALVDVWGRIHPLELRTTVGRTPMARGVSILHASVSRRHAELTLDDDGWSLTDLSSSNGTRVNDQPITTPTRLEFGDRLAFGAVGLYFVEDDGRRVSLDAGQLDSRTLRPDDEAKVVRLPDGPSETTNAGLPRFPMRFVEAPAGNGGFVEAAGHTIQLSITQYAMLRTLADRMLEQASTSALVRGFVPSAQLIADLPWDAVNPDENHLKQLIRRTRRTLDSVRLGGLIESRRGFGYRLRVIPVDHRALPS